MVIELFVVVQNEKLVFRTLSATDASEFARQLSSDAQIKLLLIDLKQNTIEQVLVTA